MNDFWDKVLWGGLTVLLFSAMFFIEHYFARALDKATGVNNCSRWQPAARPIVAIAFGLLLLAPTFFHLVVGWPRAGFGLFYGAYASGIIALVLILSASSSTFQRFAFLHPAPAGVGRRFIFGIALFLCLFVASTWGYFRFA